MTTTHGSFHGAEHFATKFDDPARDAWQLPTDVLRTLALTPSMIVADVGAGTGYFTVRLARAVPDGVVIATDLEPDMLRYLEQRAIREHLPNVRTIRATYARSGLAPSSVDAILVVHMWHHVGHHASYARDLALALRPGGRLSVVDYHPDAAEGPPAHIRCAPQLVIAALVDAGLAAQVSSVQLPDQYLVEAQRVL